jgi:hypothetical protein
MGHILHYHSNPRNINGEGNNWRRNGVGQIGIDAGGGFGYCSRTKERRA